MSEEFTDRCSYTKSTLMNNWFEERVRGTGGPGNDVFADYGFREQTSTAQAHFLNPRTRPEFAQTKPLPKMINQSSVSEVSRDQRRPLPEEDLYGFRAVLPAFDPKSEQKNFDTTSGCDYDNPNDRYKVDCHLPKDLEAVSDVVDDNLVVVAPLTLNGFTLKVGDKILDEGIMKDKLKTHIVKLTLPAILSFKKVANAPAGKPAAADRPPAGLSVIDSANRQRGVQVGLLVGEAFSNSEAASKNTYVQRCWVWDNALAHLDYGGRKAENNTCSDHEKIRDKLDKNGFLYTSHSDITKGASNNFLNIYTKAENAQKAQTVSTKQAQQQQA